MRPQAIQIAHLVHDLRNSRAGRKIPEPETKTLAPAAFYVRDICRASRPAVDLDVDTKAANVSSSRRM